jgi:hypothetical protein
LRSNRVAWGDGQRAGSEGLDVHMTEAERGVAAADELGAVSKPMRRELLRVLKGDRFPGISNRLSRDDKWLPEDDELRASDRDFLRTCLQDYADDPAWDKLVGAARRFRTSSTFDHSKLIWYALRALRAAQDSSSGVDPLHAERQARRKELLELAKSANDLTKFWQWAEAKPAVIAPWSPFPVPFDQVLQFQKSNEEQALLLLQLAGARTPAPPISRQSHSKSRDRTREARVFMRTMVGFVQKACGKPHNKAVMMLANIAFPTADFTTDSVRAAMQPTTRSARRRKSDALGAVKSD